MIMLPAVARYIVACIQGIADGWITGSNECPECGQYLGFFNTEDHIVFDRSRPNDPEDLVIIVACEGYLCIDPRTVGMADVFPDWMNVDKLHREVGIITGPPDEYELGRMQEG